MRPFRVPENRALAGGRSIALRVAVVPARDGGSSPDPLVYLAGGPGGSAIAGALGVRQVFRAANEIRDIVLVDQRGTGSSNRLDCPLPRKQVGVAPAAIRAYVTACVAGFDEDVAFAVDEVGAGGVGSRQLMFWSIVCNEPWARWSLARATAAARGTYLAERVALDAATTAVVCSAMPRAAQPAWSKARVRSDAPVLLVVGGNDPQDPPANVRDAVRELPSSRTVVVPMAGHGSVQLGCLPKLAQRFIERGTAEGLDTRCAARYSPPPFVVVR